jgi:hypothetical protein
MFRLPLGMLLRKTQGVYTLCKFHTSPVNYFIDRLKKSYYEVYKIKNFTQTGRAS